MTTGLISEIQSYSIKDGPGIRSTVFMVGCSLRCKWCCNPELMLPGKKTMHFTENNHSITKEVGYEIDSHVLYEKLMRDKVFYEESNGGVTFSGGEPGLQAEFVNETASYLKQSGIHTALDTCGYVSNETMNLAIENMDLILFDLKAYDARIHERCTGKENQQILDNLYFIAEKGKNIWIRMVIVPGWNDDLSDVEKRFDVIHSLGNLIKRVDILPYHTLGEGKYDRLGIPYPLKGTPYVSDSYLDKLKDLAIRKNIEIHIEQI